MKTLDLLQAQDDADVSPLDFDPAHRDAPEIGVDALLDSLAAHIAVLDHAGRITMCNQMWRHFHDGVLASAVGQIGDAFTDYLAQNVYLLPEQTDEIDAGVAKVTRGEAAEYRCEFAYWLPIGPCWMILSATPLDGPEQGAVVTLVDITERKAREHEMETLVAVRRELRHTRSRDELLESTADLLRRFMRSSEVSIVTRDLHTQECMVELALGRWAWTTGTLLAPGRGVTSYVAETGKPYVTENLAAFGHTYQPHRQARRQAALSVPLAIDEKIVGALTVGRDLDVAGNWPYIDSDVQLMAAIADVVAIALTRATLHEQREQLFEVVEDGLVLLDARMRVMVANPAARHHLGLLGGVIDGEPLRTLAGRPLIELMPSVDTPYHEITVDAPDTHTPDTHTFEVMVCSLPQETETNGWVLVTRDVTALRQLQEMNLQQERLAAVGQLAAGVAHDFNNILGVIGLHTELLLQTAQLSVKHQNQLNTIYDQVQEAGRLVQQILDFSRRSVFARRPVSMRSLVKDLVAVLRRTMPVSIEIQYSIDDGVDDSIVMGDAARLRQALMNLALNARDAMPDGGCLSVYMDASPPAMEPATIEGEAHEDGDWLCIAVCDTGMGISPDDQLHVFDPFFTTHPRSQHAGLGLSQVHGIVTQVNGRVHLESKEHVGTTVRLYLPRVPVASQLDC